MHRPLAVALLMLAPRLAPAQILALPTSSSEPGNWIAGGVALLNATGMRDDSRNAYWNVPSVTGYRIAIDKSYGAGATIGAAVTWSNPTMTISSTAAGGCPTGCQASANFIHYQLTYRSGGYARGTWPVAEIAAGGLRVGDVRTGGTTASPDRTLLTMSAGAGIAFATSSHFQIELVQEYSSIFAGGGFTGAATQWNTRVGMRFGFGNR